MSTGSTRLAGDVTLDSARVPRIVVWGGVPRWLWLLAVVAGLFVPRLVMDGSVLALLLNGVILGIAAVGIGFLLHQCGLVMFGVAAFIGLPAYLCGIAASQLGLGLQASVLFALASTAVFAVVVGAMVVRARPLPFAMLTLALAQMLKSAASIQALRPLTGGEDGLPMTFAGTFLGFAPADLARPGSFWPIAWLALCAVLTLAWWASRSRLGQVLRATQANEERMRFSGFDTYKPRLAAFVLASFMVSVSGVLLAMHTAFASPELLDFGTGGHALVAMLVGGASTAWGPLLGAILYTWGQDAFGATGHLELLTGIAMVVVISSFPSGAAGFLLGLCRRLRSASHRRRGGNDAAR